METIWKSIRERVSGLLILILILGATISTAGTIGNSKLTQKNVESNNLFARKYRDSKPALYDSTVDQIDSFVSKQMERHGLPGLALALVDDGEVIFMKGYGKADQTGRPITPQTPFLLASVSKPLTAVAILQLVEADQIELDTPIQYYIPEFRLADPVASGEITVRHLLLHTSGIPSTACDTRVNASTLSEYVAELQTVELDTPAGTHHSYCSGNYNILGRIIETVSGQSFGSYMQEHIFTPLEMRHSFTSEEQAQQAGMAQGYQWFFGLPVSTQHRYNPSQLPSGYMISSAEDMSHFLISQLNSGQYGEVNLLSASAVSAMQIPGADRGKEGGYGFGWVISPVGGVPAVWHDGVNINYHSLLLMQPETRRGAVMLMNSFGIVAYESAYKEIEQGVARYLAGLEPVESGSTLSSIYFIIDLVLAAILVLALLPLLRMRSWHRWLLQRQQAGRLPWLRVSLRSAWEIGFALVFLISIRLFIVTGLGAQSWYEVLVVFPDFVVWIWITALVILFTGAIRARLILQAWRASPRGNAHLQDMQPNILLGKVENQP